MAANAANTSRKREIPAAPCKKRRQVRHTLISVNKLLKKSGKKSQKFKIEPQECSEPIPNGKEEKISKALGLRSNFLDRLESVPTEIRRHRGLAGFLLVSIEDAFFDIEKQSLKEKFSEELLKQIGFTDDEVIDTIMTRSLMMMAQHLDSLDFIKRFVEDKLKYNPALLEHAPQEDDTDVWDFDDYEKYEHNEDLVFRYFHGTDRYSAHDIIKNGILLDFGRHKHDFSDGGGFYLTTSFEHAERWARSQTRKPVVLELKILKSCLEKASTKFLDVSNKEGRAEWDEVVRENRSGRPSKKLRKQLEGYDCIAGPISVFHSDRASRVPEPGSYQLCIVKQSFAKEIENNAKYTLYTVY